MKIVSARVQPDIEKKLIKDANRERISVSDMIRRILLRHYGLLNGNHAER